MNAIRCIVLALAGAISVASAKEPPYRPPRLPDGHVDLQGNWLHMNMVPLERPKKFSSLVITAEDAGKVKELEDADENDLTKPNEPAEFFDVRIVQPIRGELRSSVIVDPPDGLVPGNEAFKASKARARDHLFKAFDGPEQRTLSERCIVSPSSSPPVLLIPANDLRQIVQTANVTVIAAEESHDARLVRMNSIHSPAAVVSWTGDSIGWWEGDTLVIETKFLMPSLVGRAGPWGVYFVSPQTTVVERLTRLSKEQLLYAFTVEDPTFYTRQWKGETVFTFTADRIFECDCHEGNYSLPNALYGERVKEATAALK